MKHTVGAKGHSKPYQRTVADAACEAAAGNLTFFPASDEAIGEYSADGRLLRVWCEDDRILVRPREEIIGKHISEFVDGDLSRMLTGVFRRVAATRRREAVQFQLDVRGKLMHLQGRVLPVIRPPLPVETVRLAVRDVSGEKRAAQRLEEKERAIRQVLAMSQRMNEPLDLRAIFDLLVKEAMDATAAEMGSASLRRGNMFVSEGYYGQGTYWNDRFTWRSEDPLTQWFLVHRRPCVNNHVELDARLRSKCRDAIHLRTMLAAPILDRQGEVLGFLRVANKRGAGGFDEEDLSRVLMLIQVAAGPIQNAISLRRVDDAQQRLSRVSAALMKVQDDERRRIARVLHETTSQDLLAVKLNLGKVSRLAEGLGVELRNLLWDSVNLTKDMMQGIRTLSYVLHPPLLDESGLDCAVSWFVKGFSKRSEIEVNLEISGEIGRLPREMESTLFRVVQEALGNIHRHAGSDRASVRISREGARVTLEVKDYGKGMGEQGDDESPGAAATRSVLPGVGIAGMRERVEQLGGSFEVHSIPKKGTTIRVTLQAASETKLAQTNRPELPEAGAITKGANAMRGRQLEANNSETTEVQGPGLQRNKNPRNGGQGSQEDRNNLQPTYKAAAAGSGSRG